ncbi:hypothetical protein K431DRAFT_300125 [Polychaeton citri CBS 116435]|uniref:UBA domain-containing protein n=1 Tax=Polychaeton citri CBS 116435 TaxID=1314669 RepID=A0A9P4QHY6_9PEZI|nr:hypothetical protein K431DRAFT_300125 [Polychaeton citri CBS 116435]
MDDLLGEDWQNQSAKQQQQPNTTSFNVPGPAFNYPSLRASPKPPQSGNASPLSLSRPSSTLNGSTKPAGLGAASGGDAFGNLLGNKKQAVASNVSMQERQRQLIEEKRRQQQEQGKMWDSFGSGSVSRSSTPATSIRTTRQSGDDEEDILAAFNKSAPVDRASHFPPPSSEPQSGMTSGKSTPAASQPTIPQSLENGEFDEDDDPFGLNSTGQRNGQAVTPAPANVQVTDDDILGDLGRPITEKPPPRQPAQTPSPPPRTETDSTEDKSVAELVDMGFPADTARIALAETDGNVQAAVSWLLEQAHAESHRKARGELQPQSRRRSPSASKSPPRQRSEPEQGTVPAWMRQEGRATSAPRRQDSRSPAIATGDKDASQLAQEYGSKFLKGANAFWKSSQKQVTKTLREFQEADADPNRPKWMRDSVERSDNRPSTQRRQPEETQSRTARRQKQVPENLTNEAAMLDVPRSDAQPSRPRRQQPQYDEQRASSAPRLSTPAEPQPQRSTPSPRFILQQPPPRDATPVQKLSRQAVEDESSQAYISPARRKRPTQPPPAAVPEPTIDLFSPAPAKAAPVATTTKIPSHRPPPAITPRPQAPLRNVPPISPSSLATSTQHRKSGGEAFKRGDYAEAHESYTAALSPLPATHPVIIIVLANRALTAIKTGDAKSAVSDCNRVLEVIGPSQGSGESIELGDGEGTKDMKEFFSKALTRKAEALEHLEKWKDAAAVWRQAVEAGVGGANAIKARDRCERAVNPAPKPTPLPQRSKAPGPGKPPPSKSLGNSLQRPALSNIQSAEAVKRLREANAAAEKADDEKFALTDAVDAQLAAWKGGKSDNLRALLQSMDKILWEGAGWKKVGMSDLVMPNKVKIIYMKAIGKVHPDKIPQNATTEQRMISAAVFATLNEAWDKFKKDNNL